MSASPAANLDWVAFPGTALRGELAVPGDKSVSHRAIMLASLAEGVSSIEGFLEGADTLATAAAFRAMGVRIEAAGQTLRHVHGVGLHGLAAPAHPIDCGNAGTGMRLLAGVLCAQPFDSELVGDDSLSRRPMRRIIDPLERMGARIAAQPGGLPPLRVAGGQALRGVEHVLPVASAQVKSALLLAGLYASGTTTVREPRPTRDYTERMLQSFGWPVAFGNAVAGVDGGGTGQQHRLRACHVSVPGDFSSAAFFLVAASLVPGSDLLLRGVGLNPRRTGLLAVLAAMGASIHIEARREAGGEPVGDLRVRAARLHGIDVPVEHVADMIDEFPALFIAAAMAQGSTRIRGAEELRVKESDRIASMATGLRALGVAVEERPDGALIQGTGGAPLGGGTVNSHGDHRVAMAFTVAGQCSASAVEVGDCGNVATSFPGFAAIARGTGFGLGPASTTLSPPRTKEPPQ